MKLPITIHEELSIERSPLDRVRSGFRTTGHACAVIDGNRYRCQRGAWATWVPALGAKYINSINGLQNCLHRIAPPRAEILGSGNGGDPHGHYTREEWRRAYMTPVSLRAAENAISAQRLNAAGLGPRVLGLCIALTFRDGARADKDFTAGFLCEDVWNLPSKPPATEEEFLAAGVSLDRRRSAIRQQVNGYVVDLNAVVGVMPTGAENEVADLAARINDCATEAAVRGR